MTTLGQALRDAEHVLRLDLATVEETRHTAGAPSFATWDRASARRQLRYVRWLRDRVATRGAESPLTMDDITMAGMPVCEFCGDVGYPLANHKRCTEGGADAV